MRVLAHLDQSVVNMERGKGVEKYNLDTFKNVNLTMRRKPLVNLQALRPPAMCQSAEAAEAVAEEHHEYIFKNLILFMTETDVNLCSAGLMNLCSAFIRTACLASMSTMGPGWTTYTALLT